MSTMEHQPRERPTVCVRCGYKTFAWDRVCAFCAPDPHEAWVALHEAQEENAETR